MPHKGWIIKLSARWWKLPKGLGIILLVTLWVILSRFFRNNCVSLMNRGLKIQLPVAFSPFILTSILCPRDLPLCVHGINLPISIASFICVTSKSSSFLIANAVLQSWVSKWEPLIYSSILAKQGGHLDFGSHCTVLDQPDPGLFSSQTCCWSVCRKRTYNFCAITEVLENHQFCFMASLCKLILALLQQDYRLALWWSGIAEDWRTTLGEGERQQLWSPFGICPDTAP